MMLRLLTLLFFSPLILSETYYCTYLLGEEITIQKLEKEGDVFKGYYPDGKKFDKYEILFEDDVVLMLSFYSKNYPTDVHQEAFVIDKENLVFQWAYIYPEAKVDDTAVVSGKCAYEDS